MFPKISELSLEFCNVNLRLDRGERKDKIDITIWDDGDIFFEKDTDSGLQEIKINVTELEELAQLAHDYILARQIKKDA